VTSNAEILSATNAPLDSEVVKHIVNGLRKNATHSTALTPFAGRDNYSKMETAV